MFYILKNIFIFFSVYVLCRSGDMKTAEVLVEHGADINVTNLYNESPLYLAAENTKESTDLVKYLVEK